MRRKVNCVIGFLCLLMALVILTGCGNQVKHGTVNPIVHALNEHHKWLYEGRPNA